MAVEQLLNISWLLIVTALILVTASRLHRPRDSTRPLYIAVVVFGCIAVLLFPVISATDDLHPVSDLGDDAAWRHAKHVAVVATLALISLVLVTLTPAQIRQSHAFGFAGPLASIEPGYVRIHAGRAPPRSF